MILDSSLNIQNSKLTWPKGLGAHLSASVDDELRRRQLFEAHGPEGVQLRRADADLGAETELKAVAETG